MFRTKEKIYGLIIFCVMFLFCSFASAGGYPYSSPEDNFYGEPRVSEAAADSGPPRIPLLLNSSPPNTCPEDF